MVIDFTVFSPLLDLSFDFYIVVRKVDYFAIFYIFFVNKRELLFTKKFDKIVFHKFMKEFNRFLLLLMSKI